MWTGIWRSFIDWRVPSTSFRQWPSKTRAWYGNITSWILGRVITTIPLGITRTKYRVNTRWPFISEIPVPPLIVILASAHRIRWTVISVVRSTPRWIGTWWARSPSFFVSIFGNRCIYSWKSNTHFLWWVRRIACVKDFAIFLFFFFLNFLVSKNCNPWRLILKFCI